MDLSEVLLGAVTGAAFGSAVVALVDVWRVRRLRGLLTAIVEQEQQTRTVMGQLLAKVDRSASQAWYWTPEWQAGERESREDYEDGNSTTFASGDDFLAHLDKLSTGHAVR